MSTDTFTTEAEHITELAVAGVAVRDIEGRPFVMMPRGLAPVDLERYLQAPTRKRGTVRLHDAASFIAAVNAHKTDGTTLYHRIEPPAFQCIFNDHVPSSGQAGWRDHCALYECPLSPEWKAWTGKNKAIMTQADFAQFIEDNLPDVVEPSAAAMLEMSRSLQAKKKVSFASGIRLDNGQTQFTYEEKIDGSAGSKGQLQVPEVFTIGVPVFEGGPRYAVKARLRYRISDQGGLTMWFDLERPHKIIEHAVAELKNTIETGVGMPSLNGSSEA